MRDYKSKLSISWLVVVLLLTAGCGADSGNDSTLGVDGKLKFNYQRDFSHYRSLGHPIALRHSADIVIRFRDDRDLPAGLHVRTAQPEIAACFVRYQLSDLLRITCGGNTPGRTELTVVDAGGVALDRVELVVSPVKGLSGTITRNTIADASALRPGDTIDVPVDGRVTLNFEVLDDDGTALLGENMVQFDPVQTPLFRINRTWFSDGNKVTLDGLTPGHRSISVRVGAITMPLTIRVH